MANPVTDVLGQLTGGLGSSFLIGGLVLIGVVLFAGILLYFVLYRKKFDILVKVRSKRAEDPSIFFDKGAILTDKKTKGKYLRLLNTKYDLPVPPFKIMTKTNRGDYVELFRKSEDDFSYLTPGTIIEDQIIGTDGRVYKVNSETQNHLENDIDWYFGRLEKNKKLFDPESLFSKIMPYIPIMITGVLAIFLLWIVFDKLPAMINSMQQLANALAEVNAPAEVGTITG